MLWPQDLIDRHERIEALEAEQRRYATRRNTVRDEMAASAALYPEHERQVIGVPVGPPQPKPGEGWPDVET